VVKLLADESFAPDANVIVIGDQAVLARQDDPHWLAAQIPGGYATPQGLLQV
jgi:hypothetical protein